MTRLFALVLLSGVLVLAVTEEANAEGRRVRKGLWPFARPMKTAVPQRNLHRAYHPQPYRANSHNPYDYYEDLYPKFYGGFHSRYFTTYGYPSGDIGLRGFPW